MYRKARRIALIAGGIIVVTILLLPVRLLGMLESFPLTILFMAISVGSFVLAILAIITRKDSRLALSVMLLAAGSAVLAWSVFGKIWPGNPLLSIVGMLLAASGGFTYLRVIDGKRGELRETRTRSR